MDSSSYFISPTQAALSFTHLLSGLHQHDFVSGVQASFLLRRERQAH